MDPRFIVAGCMVRNFGDAFTTTVTIAVDANASPMEVNQQVREKAAVQIFNLYAYAVDPLQVIVLTNEDTTFGLDPNE